MGEALAADAAASAAAEGASSGNGSSSGGAGGTGGSDQEGSGSSEEDAGSEAAASFEAAAAGAAHPASDPLVTRMAPAASLPAWVYGDGMGGIDSGSEGGADVVDRDEVSLLAQ